MRFGRGEEPKRGPNRPGEGFERGVFVENGVEVRCVGVTKIAGYARRGHTSTRIAPKGWGR